MKVELEEFCKYHLTWLLDEDFTFSVSELQSGSYSITIEKYNGNLFKWEHISDEFITFLSILKDYYEIKKRLTHGDICIGFIDDSGFYSYRYDNIDIIQNKSDKELNKDSIKTIYLDVDRTKE